MEILFLGTSSMVPTKDRNLFTALLSYKNERILIDCAEGTQRQLKMAKISPTKISKILLTHVHGDHILGLPGLLQTMAASKVEKTIEIFGPRRSKEVIKKILNIFVIRNGIKIKVNEVRNGKFFETEDYYLEAGELEHTSNCVGYAFVEKDKRKINLDYLKKFGLRRHPLLGKLQKGFDIRYKGKVIKVDKATILKRGKKVSFILDSRYCKNCIEIAKNADVLVSEATFLDELRDKAREYKHLTAKQAGEIAKKAKVKKLILTHLSQRYKDSKECEKEAKKIFKNSICSHDFFKVVL